MERIFALTDEERRVLDGACSETREFAGREDIILAGDRATDWVKPL